MDLATSSFLLNLLLLSMGVWILVKGSDGVIENSAVIAHYFGISDLIIGITLVSIGTSLPELATNVYAVLIDQGAVAVGNVVGSNITNVLLVAGIAAVGLGGITIEKTMLYRDGTTMVFVYVLFSFFCYLSNKPMYHLSRLEGLVLLVGSGIYIVFLLKYQQAKTEISSHDPVTRNSKIVIHAFYKTIFSCFWVMLGAKLIVDNVVWTANKLEIPQELISATVIAFGTSLPEVAVTISGIIKKKREIALGNIIGSNIFNILLIMGITASIKPLPISFEARSFLIPYMFLTGAGFVIFMRTSWRLARWEGLLFLMSYALFVGWNIMKIKK